MLVAVMQIWLESLSMLMFKIIPVTISQMAKKKWIISTATLALIGLMGVGYWRLRVTNSSPTTTAPGSVVFDSNASDGSKSIPLRSDDPNSNSKASTDSNALKVTPAQDIGQTGLEQLPGANGPGSVPSNAQSNSATDDFTQYDKYKDQQSALFGDIKIGAGADVVAGKKVAVNYKGWLTNGQLFDQSKDGSPFVFVPGDHRVIAGWEEGIMGMKVGGKRRLVVPPAVGYGAAGKDPIPPNAVMVFDVELVAVEP